MFSGLSQYTNTLGINNTYCWTRKTWWMLLAAWVIWGGSFRFVIKEQVCVITREREREREREQPYSDYRVGRYWQHWQPKESRICPYCTHGEVETEQLFLTSCRNYQHIRNTSYSKFETLCSDFKMLNKKTQLQYLLGEKQDCILLAARYIDTCHKKREESTN